MAMWTHGLIIAATFLLFCGGSVFARPVAYKGATALSAEVWSDMQSVEAEYTLSRWGAVGVEYARIVDGAQTPQFITPKFNWLVHRWNMNAAQANLYLSGGMGARVQTGRNDFAGMLGGQADWETRRWMVMAMGQAWMASGGPQYGMGNVHAGVAPYLADFDQLQLFLIAKGDYQSFSSPNVFFSPAIKAMYRNVIVMAGASVQGKWFVNVVTEF